ncbi:lipopolysaccharide biosynthesis protein [uncultured Parabacteroides sp.]|uniref:lipopolysaccharide biosynthesis protein n=1 Tax=uncultured Parabacteroides sp. TaxID=512312 RepID=UPI0026DB485D|nr:lipopolysaccharide biosynthesis protein [uncultured Parabacteroides sp.]
MAEQTLKEKTAKGLFWGGMSNGVQQVLNLVFGLVLARILNASDYGMVGMLAIFSAIASTIQESGFTAALTNQKEIRHEDYNAVFWFSTLTGVLFYLILFFCAPLIAAFYGKPELIGLSRVVFLGFLFGGFGIASNAYLFKTLMVKERAKIDIVSLISSGTIGVILALNGWTYYGLAIQTTTYIGIGSLLKFLYVSWKPTFRMNLQPLKSMFSFSSKLILTNFFTQISYNVFSVVLGKFYNPQQLGFYSQGQKWMGMGNQLISGMINNVAQPILVQIGDDKIRQRNVFRKMVRFGAFVSFPAMLGLAFVAKEFIYILLGEKWLSSVPFLQLFCIWGAIGYLWLLYTNLLISHGKSDIYLYGMILISLLQLLIVITMFSLGIYPMVIGYIGAYYVGLLYWHYFANKLLSVNLFDIAKDVFPYIGAVLVSFLMAYLLTLYVDNMYVAFLLKALIVAIVYCSIMWYGNSIVFKEVLNYLKNEFD